MYGTVALQSSRKRFNASAKAVWALVVLCVALVALAVVIVHSRPSEAELLSQHYGTDDVFSPSFWHHFYTDADETAALHSGSHYLRQNGDFPKFIDHLSQHWDDSDANRAIGYHSWSEGPLSSSPSTTTTYVGRGGAVDTYNEDNNNSDFENSDEDLRTRAHRLAHHITVHYKLHPELYKHHRWHHWSHWYLKCHPTCHKDPMWPVEKRLAAKLLYLWDHWHVSPPHFKPHGGVYVESVTVEIQAGSKAEMVYYTTDGTAPTTSSKQYLGPIRLGMPGTFEIKAFAKKENMGPSQIVSQTYTIEERCAEPSILPASNGPFTSSVTISLESETEGAALQYTTDGTDPSGTWHTDYKSPFTIAITGKVTIKARSVKEGMAPSFVAEKTYTVQELVATPTFDPISPGPYVNSVSISLGCSTPGAIVRYTTDGSDPSKLGATSAEYTAPFVLSEIGQITVKAFATHENMAASAVASHQYNIQGRVKAPIFSPEGGKFVMSTNVEITSPTPGAKIYYTLDGSVPSVNSLVYTAPVHLASVGTNTVRAYAVKPGMADSELSSVSIDILQQVAKPKITPDTDGPFTETVEVEIACDTPSAVVRYTTDGTLPNENSLEYKEPFELTVLGRTVVSAYATSKNMGDSAVATQAFVVQGKVSGVEITPPGPGPFTESVKVEMKSPTPGASIHYTTDGTVPTASSPLYSAPLVVGPNPKLSVHAIAVENGMAASDVAEETYTVLARVSTPEIYPNGGPFINEVTIKMTCDTPYSIIHYTSDGSEPSSLSPVYHEPFVVAKLGAAHFKAICVKAGMADSLVSERLLDVIPKAPPPTLSPESGDFVTSAKITISSTVEGAVIHYTTDGSQPTDKSPVYSGPVEVSNVGMNTVKAIVTKEGMGASDSASATVKVIAKLTAPQISPDGGDFRKDELHKGALISLSGDKGATIYFTTDGSDPTAKSNKYDGDPFLLCKQGTTTIKAIATEPGLADSEASSAVFFIKKEKCLETVFGGCPPGTEAKDSNEPEDISGCTFY